jgi:hypothetical protein
MIPCIYKYFFFTQNDLLYKIREWIFFGEIFTWASSVLIKAFHSFLIKWTVAYNKGIDEWNCNWGKLQSRESSVSHKNDSFLKTNVFDDQIHFLTKIKTKLVLAFLYWE